MKLRYGMDEDISFLQRKVSILVVIVAVFILTVLGRLYYLQVYRGKIYRNLSEQISVREEELTARRGNIYDRRGTLLADHRPYFEIGIIPQFLTEAEKTITSLSRILSLSPEEIKIKLGEAEASAPFKPVILVRDAPYDSVVKIREYNRPEDDPEAPIYLGGVVIRTSPLRRYLFPELFSHVLGYLTEIDQKTLDEFKSIYPDRYSLGDLVGATGIEQTYDRDLRGIDGIQARIVDARGREVREDPDLSLLRERASLRPTDGRDLMTTLDFEAQEAAQEAMGERRGAVVALEPSSGDVLVLYSAPGFDANRIMKSVDQPYWRELNIHEDKYLFNRAIQGTYPPGSIHKIVGAFAALNLGLVDLEEKMHCGGGLQFGNRYFKCWRPGGHGAVAFKRGLSESCDVFFYHVGLRVGVDGLREHAQIMGLGLPTGIDMPREKAGLIPSTAWKERRLGQPWIESETLSVVIGQGYNLVTPLQSARMISMIANGGHPLTPQVGKTLIDPNDGGGRKILSREGESVIRKDIRQQIHQALIEVVHGNGTARQLRYSPYKIAGKTGTAQVIGHGSRVVPSERTKPHAWFVAYAPYDDPQIALAVIVENGGGGSAVAAPVAKKIIEAYLAK